MEEPTQNPQSRHFALEHLADGIYAAIHTHGGWAIANAGIVDLGDATLIFDTFMAPAAAEDLRRAAEKLTGRPAAYVVNSHYHNDHIWGNQVFRPEAKFIATTQTKELIRSEGQEEVDWFTENSPSELSRIKQTLAEETDPGMQKVTAFLVPYFEALVDTMPQLEVCYPHITFQDRLVISGTNRKAEVVSLGGGHTGDDAFLIFPDDGIAFLSDLLFVNCHPYLASGDPLNLLKILDQFAGWGYETLVPGHGPVGGPADLKTNIEYVQYLMELAEQLSQSTGPVVLEDLTIPEQYASWEFGNFFMSNMRFLTQDK